MTDRATFTYVGPEQNIRLGAETFQRHRETLVTDAETIKAARDHPEIEEDTGEGRVPVAKAEDAPQAPAPTTNLAGPPAKATAKPKAAKKK